MSDEQLPEAVDMLPTSKRDLANMDFEKVYETALRLFSDQALLDKKDISKVTIKDLEAARAKSDSFLESLGHLFEINHQVELLQADKYKFKRKDELDLLHSLRKSCTMMAKSLEKNLEITIAKLGDIERRMVDDPAGVDYEELAGVQAVMNSCVDTSQKLIASTSRLIQTERYSGTRPWGHSRGGTKNIGTIEGLDNRERSDDRSGQKGPRPLTEGEVD